VRGAGFLQISRTISKSPQRRSIELFELRILVSHLTALVDLVGRVYVSLAMGQEDHHSVPEIRRRRQQLGLRLQWREDHVSKDLPQESSDASLLIDSTGDL
jgi:hypothetical protein